jgi:predicted RNA-binding Zn-ribbon protein involved in translation (DUF1610 family)
MNQFDRIGTFCEKCRNTVCTCKILNLEKSANEQFCPVCGDILLQQVNSTNLNCVRCGETIKNQKKARNINKNKDKKKPCSHLRTERSGIFKNEIYCIDCGQYL